MRVLVVYPLDSAPTAVTFKAGLEIAKALKERGYDVDELPHIYATHLSFLLKEMLRRSDALAYLGHGVSFGLVGQMPFNIVKMFVDLSTKHLVRDKIVVTVACNTFKKFGKECPARVYFGSEHFMCVAFPTADHNYTADFIDTWKVLVLSALEKDPYRALKDYKDVCTHYIRLYERMRWEGWDVYSYALRINRDYYRVRVK